ncbi:hypothetical protein ACIA8I_32450 [Streptomyces rishiriensis]|uniref:hypothetical protein n=1 Tax=Streptomyces rishiriensis TaxID=68264 RepID=UPI0037AFAB6F
MDHAAVTNEREVTGLVVTRVGSVEATSAATLPWAVLDGAGRTITPASEFLREVLACGNTLASCRSYAFDLLRWFRFLAAVDVEWGRAKRVAVRDFVLWLRTCHNPARDRCRPDAPAPGTLNARTGKPYLRSGYAPATINHVVSVLAAFYDHHLQTGQGSVVSPVPPLSRDGRRLQAHHNPLEPFRLRRRGAYRQKQVDREHRAVPDDVVEDLFNSLSCHRDRALFSMFLSDSLHQEASLPSVRVSDPLST